MRYEKALNQFDHYPRYELSCPMCSSETRCWQLVPFLDLSVGASQTVYEGWFPRRNCPLPALVDIKPRRKLLFSYDRFDMLIVSSASRLPGAPGSEFPEPHAKKIKLCHTRFHADAF